MKTLAAVAISLLALSACSSAEPTPGTPGATKTVQGPTKTVVPQSCLDALDMADSGFGLAADAMGIVSDAFTAISEFDMDGVERASAKLSETTSGFTDLSPKYNAAKEQCRAASKTT